MSLLRLHAWAFALLFLFGALFLYTASLAQAQNIVDARRAQLEQDLADLEKQIAAQQSILSQKQNERVSLERDVSILDARIKEAKLSIKARTIAISQLTNNIAGKEDIIFGLDQKLIGEKQALASLLRQSDQLGTASLVTVAFSSQNLSAFFGDIDVIASIGRSMRQSFTVIADNRQATKAQKADLESKREEEVSLRTVQELEQQKIQAQEAERQKILSSTKGQEATYQKILAASQKSAAQIRAELFTLRGSAAIPFGKAYEYAVAASVKTGVRPAFILGIIAEESNLGENVGTGNWRTDMHPTRDVPVFQDITSRLGLNPDTMPVSKKPWYGWGGAMGPAQFIPSTWILYEKRIAKATGHTPPNPWDPGDAIMATALYTMDNGADKKTKAAEFRAAMCYLAGCGNANKSSLQFYGNEVADLAAKYQQQIDVLGGN